MNEAILLIGPTGSGKTPLGGVLENRGLHGRRCLHFDFGESLRNVARRAEPPEESNAKEHRFLRDVLEKGALLEDEHFYLAERLYRRFLDRSKATSDDMIVLNGLPRHVGQARAVDAMLRVTAVVRLICSAETVFERLRTNAGGDRTQRTDDDVKPVRRKLALFDAGTALLVDYYRSRGTAIRTIQVGPTTTAEQAWEVLDAE